MARLIDHLQAALIAQPEHMPFITKRIVLKEILQVYVLSFLYRHERFRLLRFYGGTCARIVYGLNRMSEDIDLDNTEGVSLEGFETELSEYFRLQFQNKYVIDVVMDESFTNQVVRYTVKFPLLYDLGLARVRDEKLHIKVEVSLHEQHSNIVVTPIVKMDQSFVLRHFDEPSLMAGKMVACLKRNFVVGKGESFVKGRDFYDLLWYMQRGVMPNAKKLTVELLEYQNVGEVFDALGTKLDNLSARELAVDLKVLFEDAGFVDDWLEHYKEFFARYRSFY